MWSRKISVAFYAVGFLFVGLTAIGSFSTWSTMAVTSGLSIGLWFFLFAFMLAEGSTKPKWLSGSAGNHFALTWSWLWKAAAAAGLFFWWTTVTVRIVNGQVAVPEAPDAPIWAAYIHGIIVALVMLLVGWLPRWLIDYRTNPQTIPKLPQGPHRLMTAGEFDAEVASEVSVIASRSMPDDGANMRAKKFIADALWFISGFVYWSGIVVAGFLLTTTFNGRAYVGNDIIIISLIFSVFLYGLGWTVRHFVRKFTLERCWRAAAEGNASAQNWLGQAYANGRGVQKDLAAAIAWWRKAAEQGAADAQFRLARLYEAGLGVRQDFPNATALYERAAEQGHRLAQKGIAKMYAENRCDPSDNASAAYWHERISKRKEIIAMFLRVSIAYVLVPFAIFISVLFAISAKLYPVARYMYNPDTVFFIVTAIISTPIIIIYLVVYIKMRKSAKR